MMKAPQDRMIRASVTRDEETEEEKAERERLEKLKEIWRARYKDLPRPPEHPPVPSEDIAEREEAWEQM